MGPNINFIVLLILGFCSELYCQEYTFYELEDYDASVNESFCINLNASDTILTNSYSHALYWEPQNLRLDSARILTSTIPHEKLRVWEAKNSEQYKYLAYRNTSDYGDTVSVAQEPQLKLCFTALEEGRHVIDVFNSNSTNLLNSEPVYYYESLINVGNQPRRSINVNSLFSDQMIKEHTNFNLDPIPLNNIDHLIEYSFNLVCDKNLIEINHEELNNDRYLTVLPEPFGYSLKWRNQSSTTFFYDAENFSIPMKANGVATDTIAKAYLTNFKALNSLNDSIIFNSDTCLIHLVSQIDRDRLVSVHCQDKFALRYASTPIAFTIENYNDISSFGMGIYLRESLVFDSIITNPLLIDDLNYSFDEELNAILLNWDGSTLSLPSNDTLFLLYIHNKEYHGYRKILIQGLEFLNEDGSRIPNLRKNGSLTTYTTERDLVGPVSGRHYADSASIVNIDLRLVSPDLNLMKDFRFDYVWDETIVKYRSHVVNNELFDFKNAEIISPFDIGGAEEKIKIRWSPEDIPDTILDEGIDTVSLMNIEFEVIGHQEDRTGFYARNSHINSKDTTYRGVLQFYVGAYGYLEVNEKFGDVICSIDSISMDNEGNILAAVYLENLGKMESMHLPVKFDSDVFEFVDYIRINNSDFPYYFDFYGPWDNENTFNIWSRSFGFYDTSYSGKYHICNLILRPKGSVGDCGRIYFDEDQSYIFRPRETPANIIFNNTEYCITKTNESHPRDKDNIYVYPTITSRELGLNISESDINYSVKVYNALGILVLKHINSPRFISANKLPVGMYWVEIQSGLTKSVHKVFVAE